jgi:hypothetical protein
MAPNGKTNIRWLSYQPPITYEPYPMITVSKGKLSKKSSNNSALLRSSCLNHRGRLVRPSGVYWQSSNLSRSYGTLLISLTLSLHMECNAHSVVICKGVGSKQHTPLMLQSQGNCVRTNECVQHRQKVPSPGWDGTSTGGQNRDLE